MNDYPNLLEVLNRYGNMLVNLYKERVPVASGLLRDTASYRVSVNGKIYAIELNLQDYWINIEQGRQPGKFPPIDSISEWVQVKNIMPEQGDLPSPPSIPQLNYLISRSIAENGIPARPILEESVSELLDGLYRDIQDAIVSDIQSYILNDLFNQYTK